MNSQTEPVSPYNLLKKQLTDRLSKIYLSLDSQKFVIWGTGAYGKWLLSFFSEIGIDKKVCCFCDSFHDDSKTDFVEKLPIYSPSKCVSLHHDAKYIIATDFYEEILDSIAKSAYSDIDTFNLDYDNRMLEKQLIYYTNYPDPERVVSFNYTWFPIYEEAKKSGKLQAMLDYVDGILEDQVSKDIIHNRCNTFTTGDLSYIDKNEINRADYFSQEYYPIADDEVLFDCGAFTGDTIEDFVAFTNKKYKKIVAFEPDSKNLAKLREIVEKDHLLNVEIKQEATGKENGKISFLVTGTMGAKVVEEGSDFSSKNMSTVDIIKLDSMIDYHPTLIKMDIEGSELDALEGAKEIIKKQKPKLAICVYHLPFDFYEIPKFIKSLVPEYKFKIRQHIPGFSDTVLYTYVQ